MKDFYSALTNSFQAELAFVAVAGLAVTMSAGYMANSGDLGTDVMSSQDQAKWHGEYTVKVKRDGEVVYEKQYENTLTDQGQNWIRGQIADVTSGDELSSDTENATFIAVGNGTDVQAGDTVLDKEVQCCGLQRTSGGVTTYGAGEFSVSNQFTATLGDSQQVVINTTGLNWEGTQGGNTLISGGSFADANLLDGDKLTVTHNITIS